MDDLQFFATAPKHLESLLADELVSMQIPATEARGGVRFQGSLEQGLRVCLWSRVANRVLARLADFDAATPDALYAGIRKIEWHTHIGPAATLAVDCSVTGSQITHSRYASLKVKDAIVDQLRERRGTRPDVRTEQPSVRVNLHILKDRAVVSIDLSGNSLHRRGYRRGGGPAPLKENLAAAILLRAGWPAIAASGGTLIDPMCGSGTLPIEAALIADDIAPGLLRDYWGFAGWRGHDPSLWQGLLDEARRRHAAAPAVRPAIRGSDNDRAAVQESIANATRAGLEDRIRFECLPVEDLAPQPDDVAGLLVSNPPYGKRLGGDSKLPALYTALGETLRERFCGWRATLITGNHELARRTGLRANRKHSVFNGRIECELLHFDVDPSRFARKRHAPRPLPAAERGAGAIMLANRLHKNQRRLRRWLQREDIGAWRLYDADLPEYALAVDLYEGERRRAHVQEYAAPASIDPDDARRRLREALGVISEFLELDEQDLYFKRRSPQRGQRQYERLAESGEFFAVREYGCEMLVNLRDYLDTGLFPDHRRTRRKLGEMGSGKRFLNLFAYTGTATVHVARGGAASSTTVDMSRTYLDWARRNLDLNDCDARRHKCVQADCIAWLDEVAERERYDLIFLDPPSFSNSARMRGDFDVQRDHAHLIPSAMRLLDPGGLLVFSSNLRGFRLAESINTRYAVSDISRATLAPDFERRANVHHCFEIAAP